jgi:hypothetical protein
VPNISAFSKASSNYGGKTGSLGKKVTMLKDTDRQQQLKQR